MDQTVKIVTSFVIYGRPSFNRPETLWANNCVVTYLIAFLSVTKERVRGLRELVNEYLANTEPHWVLKTECEEFWSLSKEKLKATV